MQEAGFNPLEVMRSATSLGAELLGIEEDTGSIDLGKCADLLIHDVNPLEDFKLMYGTGAVRLNDETGKAEWKRSLRYTIKSGVIYDTELLLAQVREMVNQSWKDDDHDRPPTR